jgi:ribose-phosphate pyrophosphokinase
MITFKAKDASGEIINSALSPFNFPAGEAHIKRNYERLVQPVEIAIFQPNHTSIHEDLFHIAMWADYLAGEAVDTKSVLIMPYVPGARADRGTPFGLSIYTDFINSMWIDQIIIFDPHSQKTPELLKGFENLTVVYPEEFFEQGYVKSVVGEYDGVIAPDKGALLRAEGVAKALGIPVFTATKERDEETGKLSNFKIEGLTENEFYLIVDDICDAGGTFKGLAGAAGLPWGNLDLYVSHGVFSRDALSTMGEYFENIYTTNSFAPQRELVPPALSDLPNADEYHGFHRFDVIRLLESKIKF